MCNCSTCTGKAKQTTNDYTQCHQQTVLDLKTLMQQTCQLDSSCSIGLMREVSVRFVLAATKKCEDKLQGALESAHLRAVEGVCSRIEALQGFVTAYCSYALLMQ